MENARVAVERHSDDDAPIENAVAIIPQGNIVPQEGNIVPYAGPIVVEQDFRGSKSKRIDFALINAHGAGAVVQVQRSSYNVPYTYLVGATEEETIANREVGRNRARMNKLDETKRNQQKKAVQARNSIKHLISDVKSIGNTMMLAARKANKSASRRFAIQACNDSLKLADEYRRESVVEDAQVQREMVEFAELFQDFGAQAMARPNRARRGQLSLPAGQ